MFAAEWVFIEEGLVERKGLPVASLGNFYRLWSHFYVPAHYSSYTECRFSSWESFYDPLPLDFVIWFVRPLFTRQLPLHTTTTNTYLTHCSERCLPYFSTWSRNGNQCRLYLGVPYYLPVVTGTSNRTDLLFKLARTVHERVSKAKCWRRSVEF